MRRLPQKFFITAVLPLAMVCPLKADLTFSLDSPVFLGTPGTLFDVTGSLSNPDLDPLFLNTASGSLSSGDLDFDFTNFFVLVPRTLNAGDVYAGPILSIVVSLDAQPGDYFGSFTIQGGIDENAFGDLATQNFQVTVPGTASVPEPSTFALLLSAFTMLASAHFVGYIKKDPNPVWPKNSCGPTVVILEKTVESLARLD